MTSQPSSHSRSSSRGAVVVIALTILASILSAVSLLVSLRTSARTDEALRTSASTSEPRPSLMQSPEMPSSQASTSSESASSLTETINPAGVFTRAYQDEHMRIEAAGCYLSWKYDIDFDTPRIDPAGGSDASFNGCDPGSIQSDLRKAEVSGPGATPEECLERIRTQPSLSVIPISKDLTICFETNGAAAANQGQTQKIVLMTIAGVSSDNGRTILSFSLNAWNVP
jgi:cytoskeletal protein RodZ